MAYGAKDIEKPVLHQHMTSIPSDAKGMVDWERFNKAINIEQGKTFPHNRNADIVIIDKSKK